MTDFINEELLSEEYTLKRLVYVNSANHGYSEILLDKHLAMFGQNNVGKTATLAGTKLLLFPEVNFSHCDKKFKFVGNNGTYSQEDSYYFYFPDSMSFIALEVKNPEGTFCMILYKTNNYTYGRFFIPLAYDSVRHVFWNDENNDFNDSLSIKTVKQFVIENDGIQTSDPGEIRALMFEGMRGTKKQRRFCVLPMKDARPDSIEAFRNIYQLAFDIKNSENDTLPKAIATLLEMGRGRDEERLSADLMRIAMEYSDLFQRREHLHKLKNAQPVFARVSEFFGQYASSYKEYTIVYKTLRHLLNEAQGSFINRHKEAKRVFDEVEMKKRDMESKASSANGDVSKLSNYIELMEAGLQETKTRVHRIKALFTTLGFKTIEEALGYLDRCYQDIQERLAGYKQEDGVKKQLENELKKSNQLSATKSQLTALIQNQSASVAHQLDDPTSASVISALNQNLAQTIASITQEQREVIINFTSLFSFDNTGLLAFLDTPIKDTQYLPYDAEQQVRNAKNELVKVEQQLSQLWHQIATHRQALKNDDIEKLISDTESELSQVGFQRNEIRVLNDQEQKLERDKGLLADKLIELASKRIEFEEAQNAVLKIRGDYNLCQNELFELSDQKQRFERYEKGLQSMI